MQKLAFIIAVLFLLPVPQSAFAAKLCTKTFSFNPKSSEPLAFTFPRQMRLKSEDVEWLLKQKAHRSLIMSLGRIFDMTENSPQFYKELGTIMAESYSPITVTKRVRRIFVEYYDKAGFPKEEAEKTFFAFDRLTMEMDHYSLFFRDRVLLAFMARNMVTFPNDVIHARIDVLFDQKTKGQIDTNSSEYIVRFDRYIDLMKDRVMKLPEKYVSYGKALGLFVANRTARYGEGDYSVRKSKLFKNTPKGKRKHLQLLEVFSFLSVESLIQTAQSFKKLQSNELRAINRDVINKLEEHMLFEGEVPEKQVEVFNNLIDHVLFGGDLVKSPVEVRQQLIDVAKSLSMGAKSSLSQFKSEIHNQLVQNQLEQLRARYVISENPRQGFFERDAFEPPQQSKKRKARPQNQTRNAEETVEASPAGPKEWTDSRLEFWRSNPDTDLVADKVYEFLFLRNDNMGLQKIVFPAAIAEQLNKMPQERNKFIKAINMGYTARSSKGTAGIKQLWVRGYENIKIFEVKPSYSKLRLHMTFENGLWTAKEIIEKD